MHKPALKCYRCDNCVISKLIGRRWVMFDPTGMVPVSQLVRIGAAIYPTPAAVRAAPTAAEMQAA